MSAITTLAIPLHKLIAISSVSTRRQMSPTKSKLANRRIVQAEKVAIVGTFEKLGELKVC